MSTLQTNDYSIVMAEDNLTLVLQVVHNDRELLAMLYPDDPHTIHVNEMPATGMDENSEIEATTVPKERLPAYLQLKLSNLFKADEDKNVLALFLVHYVYSVFDIETF